RRAEGQAKQKRLPEPARHDTHSVLPRKDAPKSAKRLLAKCTEVLLRQEIGSDRGTAIGLSSNTPRPLLSQDTRRAVRAARGRLVSPVFHLRPACRRL